MARLRKTPQAKAPPKPKPVVPLHRRILGRGATELDTIYDLRRDLEKAYELDQMEYDTYLDCHEALNVREAKAKEALDKATGRWVKPDKATTINVRRRQHRPRYKAWHIKLLCVLAFLIIWKIISFKP